MALDATNGGSTPDEPKYLVDGEMVNEAIARSYMQSAAIKAGFEAGQQRDQLIEQKLMRAANLGLQFKKTLAKTPHAEPAPALGSRGYIKMSQQHQTGGLLPLTEEERDAKRKTQLALQQQRLPQ